MTLRSRQDEALDPVRAALRNGAQAKARAIVTQARQASEALLEQARQQAALAVAEAEADGRAQASSVAAAQLGLCRRSAREQLLGADLTSYEQIAGQIRSAVLALRSSPGYPQLRARLAQAASAGAGPDAAITEPPEGGAVATAPGVVIDCSLGRLADRAIVALGPAMAALCGPAVQGDAGR
jgi:vacuolar-type H+-ATPase subunit E/Vma4